MSEPQAATPPIDAAAPLTASLYEQAAAKGADFSLKELRKAKEAPATEPPTSVPDATGDSTPIKAEPEAKIEEPAKPDAASEAGKALAAHKTGLEKRKNKIQDEIDALTHDKHATRRDVDAAKAELEAVRREMAAAKGEKPAVAAKPADGGDPEPQEEDFEQYRDFVKAQAKWEARQILAEERAAAQKQHSVRTFAQAQDRVWSAGEKKYSDFAAVVDAANEAGIKWSPALTNIVLTHPQGEDLAYALAKDPALSQQLSAIPSALHLGIALAPVLSRLTAAPDVTVPADGAKPQTKAQDPPKTVGSAPTASPSLATVVGTGPEMNLKRYRAVREGR